MFEELASSPAGIEASEFCDAYGLIAGGKCEAVGAEQAYTQAEFKNEHTWIKLPQRYKAHCLKEGKIKEDGEL